MRTEWWSWNSSYSHQISAVFRGMGRMPSDETSRHIPLFSFSLLVSYRIQISILMCFPSKQPILAYVQPWQHRLSSCLSQWPAEHNTANHHRTADRSKVLTSLCVPCQAWRLWALLAASTQTNYLTLLSTCTPVCFSVLSRYLASSSPIYPCLFLHSYFSLLLSFSILPKLFIFPSLIHAVV